MSVVTGDVVADEFTTSNPSTGAAADADSTPTGTLYVDGTADAAVVTITNQAGAGEYKFSVTMPTLASGQRISVGILATVAGVTGRGIVWRDYAEVRQTGDSFTRLGAAGAGLTALGDTRLANLDATVSSRSTYAGGAVASVTAPVTLTAAYDPAKTAAQAGDAMTLTTGERTSVADALLKRDLSAVTGAAARSPLNALRALRNRFAVAAGTYTVYEEDDTTPAWTAPVTTDPLAEPIIGADPT